MAYQDRDGGARAETGYLTWSNDKDRAAVLAEAGRAFGAVNPVVRSVGTNVYMNVGPGNQSVRDGFNRGDYEYFRPGEAGPSTPKGWIDANMRAYEEHAILKNVVDLMSEFCAQGADLVHPNARIEKFYKQWWKKVDGYGRSERFVNMLLKGGQSIVRRHTARLSAADEEKLKRTVAAPDAEFPKGPRPSRREIPVRYTIFDPRSVELLNEDAAPFIGQPGFRFSVKVPTSILKLMRSPNSERAQALLRELPADVSEALKSGKNTIELDPEKTTCWHYKKDDSEAWARPFASPVLKNFRVLEKLQLADLAALDGAISSIRVWRLGSLEHRCMPSPSTMQRLAEQLANNLGGGVMDVVWGPDIDLVETSTEVHRFLGEGKYAPTLKAIYAGLGIPQALTGESNGGGFTNNYFSLKTLIERLQYVRKLLVRFWEGELRLVQEAMGFRFPATLTFDQLLTDEASERQLLLNMADRDLISIESLQDRFGLSHEIEDVRIRRDQRRRKSGLVPRKASPFHDANRDSGLEKIFAGTGQYTPGEFGLEMEERGEGEVPPAESASQQKAAKPKGQPGQGRPPFSKDKSKRKEKKPRPKRTIGFVRDVHSAERALGEVARVMTPLLLGALGKKSLRELTDRQAADFEELKFAVLCRVGVAVTEGGVREAVSDPSLAVPERAGALLKATVDSYTGEAGRPPSLETLRKFQAGVYAAEYGEGVVKEEA
jgi:hypothetical protein